MFPGIALRRSSATLYKIPVTADLARHVRNGTYPDQPTVVSAHVPDVLRPDKHICEGMKPLDNREVYLRTFEAFKGVAGL
jgi:hypothetical protein